MSGAACKALLDRQNINDREIPTTGALLRAFDYAEIRKALVDRGHSKRVYELLSNLCERRGDSFLDGERVELRDIYLKLTEDVTE